MPKVQQTRESHEGPGVDRLIFTSAQQKQEQYHQLCLIILQIKSGEGGHIIGLRNLNWNLHKWNASVTSASHLMQRPTRHGGNDDDDQDDDGQRRDGDCTLTFALYLVPSED